MIDQFGGDDVVDDNTPAVSAATGAFVEVFTPPPNVGADRSLYLKGGAACFYVYAPAYSELCSTSASWNDGAWHHVAGTLGASGQNHYVDGALAGNVPGVTSSAFNWNTGFRAGYGYIGPDGPLVYLTGDLDEIRLWSVERTAGEIAAARATPIDPMTAGLHGYWKLDAGPSSMIARDSTWHGYYGALIGFAMSRSPWITPGLSRSPVPRRTGLA
jgi:hypothetical protein